MDTETHTITVEIEVEAASKERAKSCLASLIRPKTNGFMRPPYIRAFQFEDEQDTVEKRVQEAKASLKETLDNIHKAERARAEKLDNPDDQQFRDLNRLKRQLASRFNDVKWLHERMGSE